MEGGLRNSREVKKQLNKRQKFVWVEGRVKTE